MRNFASAALHLAIVAAGRLDTPLSTNCKLWDIAAGCVLVTVAGAIVTTPEGELLFPLNLAAYAGEELPTLEAGATLHRRSVRSC